MATEVIIGVATWYAGQYVNQPLFCGGTYTETTAPWVALPFQEYGKAWTCGEPVYLEGVDAVGNAWHLAARVMDTGPFGDYCVTQRDGSCPPIVVDVPWHLAPWEGMSSRVTVRMIGREAAAMGMVQ
jgi:hypothetical protein